jgi:hypothetical protein
MNFVKDDVVVWIGWSSRIGLEKGGDSLRTSLEWKWKDVTKSSGPQSLASEFAAGGV